MTKEIINPVGTLRAGVASVWFAVVKVDFTEAATSSFHAFTNISINLIDANAAMFAWVAHTFIDVLFTVVASETRLAMASVSESIQFLTFTSIPTLVVANFLLLAPVPIKSILAFTGEGTWFTLHAETAILAWLRFALINLFETEISRESFSTMALE